MLAATGFYFAQPWWLLTGVLVVPIIALAFRSLCSLGPARRWTAIILRSCGVVLLACLLARPMLTQTSEQLTLMVVLDRSESIPADLHAAALGFLDEALAHSRADDRLAVVDVAEAADISQLSSTDRKVRKRNTTLLGGGSDLAAGVRMALAIAPPDTAKRILLVSDGNETAGDLRAAARIAAANGIPIDVLPLRYKHSREVVFQRLVAPPRARRGQTVNLRFILTSTAAARGKLMLSLNGRVVDLQPGSPGVAVAVDLKPGTNVKTVSLPLGPAGMHEFEATFVPQDATQDGISQNNRAGAITFVTGPGCVLVVDADGRSAEHLAAALKNAGIDARYRPAAELGDKLPALVNVDAVVLVNTPVVDFSFQQQRMLIRYVTDLGGGLVMVGGPKAFGAGGWIGSPLAEILPVDLDPPQKKQMPRGALVLIMHACEMPRGNYWGKNVAIAAVRSLSRLDLVGVMDYGWNAGRANWVYPLGPAGDKTAAVAAIKNMQMGDMPDFHAPMQAAFQKLRPIRAGQKHMIIISDGDPQPPSAKLLKSMVKAGITCTGVAVFPHSPADVKSLRRIALATGGRFYNVKNPSTLPQIFIKEAQVVRRALIVEQPFRPKVTYSLSEILKGQAAAPPRLEGYVLTGRKGGLTRTVLTSGQGDPILATGQAGLGRCLAFTSAADSRWAPQWLKWGGFERFWEQAVRWTGKGPHGSHCELFADVRGRDVTVTLEALDAEGRYLQLSEITAQSVAADMTSRALAMHQVGPGRYQGWFRSRRPGCQLVMVRYKQPGRDRQTRTHMVETAVVVPYAPEFRDLSDNAALLRELAEATGGRVVSADPRRANLFDGTGVKYPRTAVPLRQSLLLAWLAVFLLDVAVRRVVVDFRAVLRRVGGVLGAIRSRTAAVATLDRLKARRGRLRERLEPKGTKSSHAARRYEAGQVTPPPLEIQSARPADPEQKPAPVEQKDDQPTKQQHPAHLQQLLKAKRQAAERLGMDKNKNQTKPNQSGDN